MKFRTMQEKSFFQEQSLKVFEQLAAFRRELHQHPELSFNEVSTAGRITRELKKIGVSYVENIGGSGVIALIEGSKQGPTVGVRAEMDALPIQEETGLDFASVNSGVMHACGHDIHMANLIGIANILQQYKSKLRGRVMLVFQPGEELLPGGAIGIISSSFFKNNKPDIMLGMHILPELQLGKVGFKSGGYMASGDEIYLTVKGKGGHAALPHSLIDPVLIASHTVIAMQQIVSRNCPSSIPSVLSFGKVAANGANNIIPSEVHLEGTFRTMDETWRLKAHELITNLAQSMARSMGGECEVEIRKGYPTLSNSSSLVIKALSFASEYLGQSKVVELPIRMTTDDFAYYSQVIPSVYFRVGTGKENETLQQLHSSTLKVDDEVLKNSVGLMCWLIVRFTETDE